MLTPVLCLLAFVGLVSGAVQCVRRARKQRRPTPRPGITPEMQRRMAHACVTAIAARGIRELPTVNRMAAGYALRRSHFEALTVRPEEDHARALLITRCRVA